jgi:hypothetical protein
VNPLRPRGITPEAILSQESGLARHALCVLALVAGGPTACAGRDDAVGRSVVRDSLAYWRGDTVSLQIVDNPSRAPSTWRLASTPDVSTNGGEDDRAPFFRIVRVLRLSDGRIVVADGGSTSIRVLSAEGREAESIGGQGEGPGEFRSLSFVGRLPGDSIVVADLELARLSVFDARGQYVREVRWGTAANSPASAIVGVFDDGSYLARGFISLGYPPPHGLRRHAAEFYHLRRDGTLADTIGAFPGTETYFLPTERGFRANPGLFAQTLSFATGGRRFYTGSSDTYQFGVYSSDGRPLQLVRASIQPVRVSAADVAAEKQSRLQDLPANDQRASLERMLAEMPVPETMPTFDRILVDEEGTAWVRAWQPVWESDSATWTVFDPEGRVAAEVRMPHGLVPHQIGRDYVLAVATDDLDVERVQLWTLERSETAR